MTDISPADALAELKRELGMRARVYPRWIAGGTLKQEAADLQIARLKRAIEIVEERVKGPTLL